MITTPSLFHSAPSSPTSAGIPFHWEEKPGTPKSSDFAFDFRGHLARRSLPADELFHGGKIKPLRPPPRLYYDPTQSSPPKISPRRKSKDADPFAAAIELTTKDISTDGRVRGRERNKGSSRSRSPFRTSDLLFDQSKPNATNSFWYKKWKIKELLLFRSASESRAKEKKTRNDVVRNSSFRSTESAPPIELHYTVNREEIRRRMSPPYKRGLLGCLRFNRPAPSKEINPTASLPRV
ncbi:hypothetical protein AAHA92_03786 [Salvia divinorum]